MALNVTNDNIEEVLTNGITVLDFWAEWCGPCRMLTPIIDDLSNDNIDGVTIGKVNVDNESVLATKYGIRSIPTLVYFKNGVEVARTSGMQNKVAILDKIKTI